MYPKMDGRIVFVSQEDYEYIEELYRKITREYRVQAGLARVKPIKGESDNKPKFGHVISFLREHSAFSDKEIQNFAARFVKLKKEFGMRQKCLIKNFQ